MQGTQIQVPKLDRLNKGIIISLVVGFLIQSILLKSNGISLTHLLGLSSNGFWGGHLYQILLYPFLSESLFAVLLNSMLFWFLGSELVNIWGERRYISFLLTSWIGGGLIFCLAGLLFVNSSLGAFPLTGSTGVVEAMLVAYAVLFPEKQFSFMFIFPIKAKYFCLIIVAMQLYTGFFSPGGISAWGHLGSMACGFFWMMRVAKMSAKQRTSSKTKKKKSKAKLKLVTTQSDDSQDPPKYLH